MTWSDVDACSVHEGAGGYTPNWPTYEWLITVDGRDVTRQCQSASVSEGWADIIMTDDQGRWLVEDGDLVTTRLYGGVRIRKRLSQRRREHADRA